MIETIFALSSGAPPAALGIIRVSGPAAGTALAALAGRLPEPRRASLARLRDAGGNLLDEALVLWLPGPRTATGEDVVELHCHGGRAVIAAVETALAEMPGSAGQGLANSPAVLSPMAGSTSPRRRVSLTCWPRKRKSSAALP